MNNIAFGQYVPGNSWIYKLDPRTKIILTILLIIELPFIPFVIIWMVIENIRDKIKLTFGKKKEV